jgi:ATP-dependent helicase YprA (DUF1998 family)
VLIAQDNPLDQYFMRHPRDLFGRAHEHALTDPANPYVLAQHLPCAAQEFPLGTGAEGKGPTPTAAMHSPRRALPGGRRRPFVQPAPSGRVKPPLPPGLGQGDDEVLFGAGFPQAMVALENAGDLEYRGKRWYSRPGAYPAQEVSVRALAGYRVALMNAAADYRLMEEMEATGALYRLHPGAI